MQILNLVLLPIDWQICSVEIEPVIARGKGMGLQSEYKMDDKDDSQAVITRIVKISYRPSEGRVLLICGVLCLSIFLFDISMKIGFIVSVLYLIPAVICIWSPRRRTIFLVATVSSILTIVAIPLKPPGDFNVVFFNRPVSLVALWTTVFLTDLFVAAQRRIEGALKEERDKLSSLINSISDEVWFADANGEFTLANQSALQEFNLNPTTDGISVKQFATKMEVFNPDGKERALEEAPPIRALKGEAVKDQVEIVRSPSKGELRHRQVNAAPVRDSKGRIIGSVSVVKDITERKKIEDELQAIKARLEAILNQMPVGITVIESPDGQIIYQNNEVARLFRHELFPTEGIEEHEKWQFFDLYGKPVSTEDLIIGRSLREGIVIRDRVEKILRGDGTYGYLSTTSAPIRGKDGKVIAAIAMNIDVTNKYEADLELNRSNAELQQFAYVASHDLQEPLRMVINYLSLLETRFKDQLDPMAREYIDFAVEGGSRMRQLVNDLLEYSRVETTERQFAPVKMDDVVSRTLSLLKMPIEESRAEIIVDPLPTIMADESQMMQVMQNLIGNAIKFHGKERPLVHVSASKGSREWTFSVKDNGIGLNMKYEDKIFQMFQRLHSMDEYPGTGVGLAVTKKIIEHHGGRIWVESEEGKGAIFYFTIPTSTG
jgi:PAS domain S-box-containing protein